MIYVNEKDLVVPGELLAEDDYYPGRGTFEDDGKICSKLLGLVSLRNKKISVIPLKSKYLPKKGDVVIGKIDDVRFSMWGVDINSPYSGILPASEVFGREKKELSRVFDIGDVLFLRIVDVDEVKKVKLGRLIGKKGSMINMIKDKTCCKIVVGQNGLVWVKGNEDMEQIVKNIIKLIEREAHTSGLTDRIKNKLCLLIDGELPPEEEEVEEIVEEEAEEEDAFEEGLKKPELQDFRDEVEKELAEEGFLDDDSEEDLDDDDSEEDEFEDDVEDFNDETEDYEDIDEEDLDDEDSEDEDEEDLDDEDSEEEIEDFEDDISDEELEDVISDAISEDEEDVEEDSEDLEDSEEEISEEEAVEEDSEDEDAVEDEEAPEEEVEEVASQEDSEDDEKEEKSKKPNFMDTYEFINEQKKNNKSSFDLSRADNSKSPTLNISQGRGI